MKTTDGMTELDIYAEAGAKTRPDVSNYEAGVVPGQDLPAVWWNYFLSMFSSNSDLAHSGLSNIFAELTTVLASSGLTPDNATTTQIDTALKAKYLSRVGITVTDFNAIVTSSLPQGSVTSFTAGEGYSNGPTGASTWSGLLVRSQVAADSAILIAFGNVANVGETVNPIAFRVKSAGTWLSWLYVARRDSLDTHAALTSPHSATSAATASRLIVRDSSGRAKVAAPSAADDIARKDTVTAAVGTTVVAADATLAVNTKVLATKNVALTLPSSAVVGDSIEISALDSVRIKQSLAENLIVSGVRDEKNTTKGLGGNGVMLRGSKVGLSYKGILDLFTNIFTKDADPAVLPTSAGTGWSCCWSPSGRYLVMTYITSPYIIIYDWSTGVPVKVTDPATLPAGESLGSSWSPDGRYLAISHKISPYITIYDWSTGVPVKVTDPATLPIGESKNNAWSPDGRYLTVVFLTSPYLITYDWSTGVPVKIADPATLPTGGAWSCCWSPDGRYLAISHVGSPYLTIYDWSTGVPVKIANPAVLAGESKGNAWSPDGRYLAVTATVTPYITIYDWSTGVPVKIANPAILPGSGWKCAWSPDGKYLATTHQSSPYVNIYDWSTGVPVKVTDPAILPNASGTSCAWSPNGRYLVVGHGTSRYIIIYDTVTESYATASWEMFELAGTTYLH